MEADKNIRVSKEELDNKLSNVIIRQTNYTKEESIKKLEGIELTSVSFDQFFSGFGSKFITFAVFFFAFSTLITWSYYGETAADYILGKKVILPYKVVFVIMSFFGAVKGLDLILNFSDLMIGLLVIPNTICILYLSPKGKSFNQKIAKDLSKEKTLNLICGHFEGVDERILKTRNIEEFSIGDYILSGGESASFVVIDTVLRLLPGVIGNNNSKDDESFEHDLLEYPHYTRPQIFREMKVPQILLSGNHKEIEIWRGEQMLKRTFQRRKDLIKTDSCDPKVFDYEVDDWFWDL